MNNLSKIANLLGKGITSVAVLTMVSLGAWAQNTTASNVRHGESTYETEVRNAEVAYVSGNDLVLKLEDGTVEHLVVPEQDRFAVDGQEVSVNELKPGTKLTQTITTTSTPRYVTTVKVIEGKIWHVQGATTVLVTSDDGTNHAFKVPKNATFTVNGQQKTVFDLKKGMKFKATTVTDETQIVTSRMKSVVGVGPATPSQVGVLLFMQSPPAQVTLASAEQPDVLPRTGSALPLIGLLGALALVVSVGFWAMLRA